MKRVLLIKCGVVVWLSSTNAFATSIDFTHRTPNANVGPALVVNSDLTLTAKSDLASGDDPLFVAGKNGTIFWGKLGSLNDPDCGSNCTGIGVQNAGGGGSKGISGDGGDQDEAVVFTFTSLVDIDTVYIDLLGMDSSDIVNVYVEYTPSQSASSDVVFFSLPFVASDNPYTIDFSALAGLSGNVLSIAVAAAQGHFGIYGLCYDGTTPNPVPEPMSMLLLASGIVGAGLNRRKNAQLN